jgi:hypothetical protein
MTYRSSVAKHQAVRVFYACLSIHPVDNVPRCPTRSPLVILLNAYVERVHTGTKAHTTLPMCTEHRESRVVPWWRQVQLLLGSPHVAQHVRTNTNKGTLLCRSQHTVLIQHRLLTYAAVHNCVDPRSLGSWVYG